MIKHIRDRDDKRRVEWLDSSVLPPTNHRLDAKTAVPTEGVLGNVTSEASLQSIVASPEAPRESEPVAEDSPRLPCSPLFTVKETAQYLRVSEATVRRLIAEKKLTPTRIRRRVLLRRDILDKWISEQSRD